MSDRPPQDLTVLDDAALDDLFERTLEARAEPSNEVRADELLDAIEVEQVDRWIRGGARSR
jgi:hypothetical protein